MQRQIEHAGIPQGSPLSPILFIFYNANLVEQRINRNEGSIGFIDDYTTWVTSKSEEEATAVLQATIIPKATRWTEESGATFEADKTGFIHFTRGQGGPYTPLRFGDVDIYPQPHVKILGVVLDSQLNMKAHVKKVVSRMTARCLALQRLKGLRPKQARQLYLAAITPATDYAASTWYANQRRGSQGLISALNTVQRLGARSILGAFKGVSLAVLEAEAHLEPVTHRLHRKVTKHLASLYLLPETNPATVCLRQYPRQSSRYPSPLFATWSTHEHILQQKRMRLVPRGSPWIDKVWTSRGALMSNSNEEEALQDYQRSITQTKGAYFTDGSVRNGLCGSAAVEATATLETSVSIVRAETVSSESTGSVLGAELQAIWFALQDCMRKRPLTRRRTRSSYTIFTDSKESLRRLSYGDSNNRVRDLCEKIFQSLDCASERNMAITLKWIPAAAKLPGHLAAHNAARAMSEMGCTPSRKAKNRIYERAALSKLLAESAARQNQQNPSSRVFGQYTWRLDAALPGKHTLRLYDQLGQHQAAVLVQARSGHNHLNSYLARIGAEDSDRCSCNQGAETIEHIILRCPKWESQRLTLIAIAGPRWGDMSSLLGGYSSRKAWNTGLPVDGPKEKWKPCMKVVKATIEFLIQTGRMTAQPGRRRDDEE